MSDSALSVLDRQPVRSQQNRAEAAKEEIQEMPVLRNSRGMTAGDTREKAETLCAVSVRDLSAYYGSKQVLRGVSAHFSQNAITALIGPSGCGKTTFLRTLNKMSDTVPGFRATGQIEVLGQNVNRISDVEGFRRSVGMLFQRPNVFPMSIMDNLTLALKLFGVKRREREEIAKEKLREVGLWEDLKDRLSHAPSALSGGQQQRLCLARALTVEPQVLLLDEPASALDPKSTRLLEDLFVRLSSRMSLVLVTHNLAQAKRIAHQTAFLEAGELVEFADTETLFHFPVDERTQIYVQEQIG
ncbi:MAG: phosphate ABC transporter ATP-binding protein [Firmicutes bacterium]|nr:phosphate ABC transporter ATP-binding protein [Bacillota bacterium]